VPGKFIVTDLNMKASGRRSASAPISSARTEHGGRVAALTNDLKRQTDALRERQTWTANGD
jgi:hypothetical protein